MKHGKIVLSFLIVILILFSGCIIVGDEDYATAKYQYSMGWILHDINSSTPVSITYSSDELAVYNYSYDYPAGVPNDFINYFTYLTPVPRNLSEETLIIGNVIAVPLNRTYYVKGTSPPSENYRTNWSFFNEMDINYVENQAQLPFIEMDMSHMSTKSHLEKYNSSGYTSIVPVPGSNLSVSFGKAPYTPASLSVDNNSVRLSDYLMRGYVPLASLWRDTKNSSSDSIPIYSVYLNGNLVYSGNITDSAAIWNHTVLNYSFADNGTYFVSFTIPSEYPVWNLTTVEAKFSIPNTDVQPPVLRHIEAKPYFEYNVPYNISINATDESGIKNISAYYAENSSWTQLDLYNHSGIFETNLTVTNTSVSSLDFKVSMNDSYGNQINYTIQPIALLGRNVSLTVVFYNNQTIQGGLATVSGTIHSDSGGLSGLSVGIFSNGVNIGNALTSYSSYSTSVRLPCGPSSSNITARFAGTGIYIPAEAFNDTGLSFTLLNFSVNDMLPLHTISVINASGGGANITINRSSWSYSGHMDSKYFYFTPRHYGNYTITLSTNCSESSTKTVFANVTSPPSILGIVYSPNEYPLAGRDFDMYVSTYSQENSNLAGNFSNSTTTSVLNFNFTSSPSEDSYTGELYNYSYCYDCWMTNMSSLPSGIYNISLENSDILGQKGVKNDTIYVYPEFNITFNATDYSGNPLRRSLYLGSNYSYYTWYYNINGPEELDMLPNMSYFNKTFQITLINGTGLDENIIRFINSTVLGNISVKSDYIENKTEFQDKIIYATYFFNTSWNYSGLYTDFTYSNVNRFNMHNKNRSSVYVCKSYNIAQHQCSGSWTDITSWRSSSYSSYVEAYGSADDPQAVAFGESLSCGDGYCSPSENCSSCHSDCNCLGSLVCQNGACVSPSAVCGNGNCDSGETCASCPSDCGCPSNQICLSGLCTVNNSQGSQNGNQNSNQNNNGSSNQSSNNSSSNGNQSENQSGSSQSQGLMAQSECPFECCMNETLHTDKECNSTNQCINNVCMSKSETGTFDPTMFIFVIFGAVTIAVFLILYVTVLKKRVKAPPKVPEEDLASEIASLTNDINSLRYRFDTSQMENELNLARFELSKGLKETAKVHIDNVKRLKESVSN